jgi:uncharacterized protein
MSRIQVLTVMGITAVILFAIAKLWLHLSGRAQMPIAFSWTDFSWGIGLGLCISLLSLGIYFLWDNYRQSADFYLELILKPLVLADLIWIGLLPGLSEELLFRGVVLPSFGLTWQGVLFSSLLFGLLHMTHPRQWAYVVWATVIGGLLGISAIWSENLLVPIVAHILTNTLSGVIWKLRMLRAPTS